MPSGEKLAELGACNNCHFYGEVFPLQGVQTWAPNLAMSKDRLRSDWVIEWLKDPQKIMPGTKMPAPYLPTADLLLLSDAKETWGTALIKANGDSLIMLEGLDGEGYYNSIRAITQRSIQRNSRRR